MSELSLRAEFNQVLLKHAGALANYDDVGEDYYAGLLLHLVVEAVEGMLLSPDRIVEIASKHCVPMPTSITAIQEGVETQLAAIVAWLKGGGHE